MLPRISIGIVASALLLRFATTLHAGESERAPQLPYDLAQVRRIEGFVGSSRAKDLLSRQGFVATEEQFSQIFQPYLPSPDGAMPTFITVDSAWHTYHVLLEEGVQQVELGQARLLQRFSERLHKMAAAYNGPSKAIYHDLAAFAAVGWAVQDSTCLHRLPADQRLAVAQTLKAIEAGGTALFFQLPLQPANFRPAGFYTKTPDLARYFKARRWYASSDFRLKSEAETLRALHLTLLVESDVELRRLHRQLTTPLETMVGPSDDPGVAQYEKLASKLAKGPLAEEKIPLILSDFRRQASTLSGPRVNDQFLLPEQFAARKEETKGMRLFGGCQLPSAILFQKTTEPTIPNRFLPSGADMFAAGPMACDAGRRALKAVEPNAAAFEAVCRTDCGPLPDSLHGQAMQLLLLIHEPLPRTAPLALRTPAWQDKQLGTALGAWAEERHTWVLHTKPAGYAGCVMEWPPGYVSPYPKFYRQLGQLARRAAAVLPQVAAEPDCAAAGREWLDARHPRAREMSEGNNTTPAARSQDMEDAADLYDRMHGALAEYFRRTGTDIGAVSTLDRAEAWAALDAAATHCAEDKGATDDDRRCMRAFLRSPEGNAVELLPDFAKLCDQLATIADKELAAQPLDRKEIAFIKNYGETLARFHFYAGETYRCPRDDFACVAPVFTNPLRGKTLYVGVSRPEAIYVVLFVGKHLVLHRGAILSYREFSRPLDDEVNDDKWREEVKASLAPLPPAWTASFRCTTSRQEREQVAKEAAARLRQGKLDLNAFAMMEHEATLARIERLLAKWQALKASRPALKTDGDATEEEWKAAEKAKEARDKEEGECSNLLEMVLRYAVDEDVPDLLDKVLPVVIARGGLWEISDALHNLNWTPYRAKLVALAHHSNPAIAELAAVVLSGKPEKIDIAALAKVYDQQPAHVRAVYCHLIGHSQKPGPEGLRVLAAGLCDKAWKVRYQAAAAVAECHVESADILAAVRRGLDEEQPKVAAAMVHAAAALGFTDTAPRMLARLQKQVKTSRLNDRDKREPDWTLEKWDIKSLTTELIAGLGELKYLPAKDLLRDFVFPNTEAQDKWEYASAAVEALLKIEPQEKKQLLADIFRDPRSQNYLEGAIVKAAETGDIEYVKTMLPLFENVARTRRDGRSSQAVWAAWHITGILEHADPPSEGAKLFEKIRSALLKQTHGPDAGDALAALMHFDPATSARV
jgi:hypothetical protein